MNKVFLLLGSNLSEPAKQLELARTMLRSRVGKINSASSLYHTAAWGFTSQPDFLNQVLLIQTKLTASETLEQIMFIEKAQGRSRTKKNAPRIIDIDILFYNRDIVHENNLIIPHPAIAARRFVLVPLVEIDPQLIHPVLEKTVHQLLEECTDELEVKRI